MHDPYDILGVARGASFEEIKAAYRRACKAKHPDMGGSHQAFIELQAAYEHILRDLRRGYQQRREEAPRKEHAHQRQGSAEAGSQRRSEQTARDIEEELEELRRTAEAAARAHEEALRARREQAWQSGEHRTWAKLTWDDFGRFFVGVARSGLKGLSLLFAAVVGIGTVLVEANVVSAVVLAGSGIGFVLSHALKSDKGGLMSAGLLLFGLMTIWLLPVRAALFLYPLATISVLLCLALIFKFGQQGGRVGLLTGGVLSLYMIGAIVVDTEKQQQARPTAPSGGEPARQPSPTPNATIAANPQPTVLPRPSENLGQMAAPQAGSQGRPATGTPAAARAAPSPPGASVSVPPPAPEARVLLASEGAVLKFVAGVPYQLKVRSGRTTLLFATAGQLYYAGDEKVERCVERLTFRMEASSSSYESVSPILRSCRGDAIVRVMMVE